MEAFALVWKLCCSGKVIPAPLSKQLLIAGIRGVINGPNMDLDYREDSGRIGVISPNDQWGFLSKAKTRIDGIVHDVYGGALSGMFSLFMRHSHGTWIMTWHHGIRVVGLSLAYNCASREYWLQRSQTHFDHWWVDKQQQEKIWNSAYNINRTVKSKHLYTCISSLRLVLTVLLPYSGRV